MGQGSGEDLVKPEAEALRVGLSRALILLIALVAIAAVCTAVALASEPDEATSLPSIATGQRVELPNERTATSNTFRLPDGERETRIYQYPINFRTDSGKWKPIEEGLHETASGTVRNGEGAVDLSLPASLQAGPTRVTQGDEWVTARLEGTSTQAVEVEGGTATYESPDSDAAFEYTTLPEGLKEEIKLGGPDSPATFQYDLSSSSGLVPKLLEDGSIEFKDGEGEAAFVLPAPTVVDAASTKLSGAEVDYSLSPNGDGSWSLALEVDRAWLDAADRQWPVTIDPTIEVNARPTLDCQYWVREPTNETNEGLPECGKRGTATETVGRGGYRTYRSALRFDLSAVPKNSSISTATVNLFNPWEAPGVGTVQLRRVTRNWYEALNWFSYNNPEMPVSKWQTPGGDLAVDGSELSTAERGTAAGWWIFRKGLPLLVSEWVEGSKPNYGFALKLADESYCACTRSMRFYSTSSANAETLRPYMSVVYRTPAPASSQVVSPTDGTRTARRLKLKARWTAAGVTGVTFLFREGKTGAFQNIPPGLVQKPNGATLTKWPLAVSGVEETGALSFDAAHLSAKLQKEGGPIQVRAWFDALAPASEGLTSPVEVFVNRFTGSAHDAVAQVGPGKVDLLTGNLSLSRTDVSIPGSVSGLEFSRSFNTRGIGAVGSQQLTEENKSALGPGWKPGVPVEEAGGSEWRNLKLTQYSETTGGENGEPVETYSIAYALLTTIEGGELAFEKRADGTYATPPEATGWSLTTSTTEGITRFFLADPAGNRTTFENPGGGTEFVPTAISQVGSGNTTRIEWELPEGKKRVRMVIAPTPAGVSCATEAAATTNAGCHALIFTYAAATTWGAPSTYGARLSKITYYAPGKGGPWEVANYRYDSNGRLIEVRDPRIQPALPEKYTYNVAGQLATITPAGQKPWELAYAQFDEEAGGGRLVAAKRDSLVGGTAQTTVAYGTPLTGTPYDLGLSAIGQWGQKVLPVDATAVFPPREVPSNPPSAYTRATIYYMDAEGYRVNTVTPKGGGTSEPSISTTETDEYGNVVRELTPANRLRVLAKPETQRRETWEALETKRHFNEQGTQMVEEWGPMHKIRLESGTVSQARLHKVVEYDAGWPGTGVKPHLPTREVTGASIPEEGVDAEQRTVETKYSWNLRRPTEVIVDPGTGHLNIRHLTVYDEVSGLPVESRQPIKASEANTPGTTRTIYYKASGVGECEGVPRYANLPCKILPGAQTSGSGRPELLVKRILSYNALGEPTEVSESPGGGATGVRRTTLTYDAAGRQLTKKVDGGGEPIPKTETVYDSSLGLPKQQRFICEGAGCSESGFAYQSSFGSSGSATGQFAHPAGIAIDAVGNLWIADQNNKRLEKFNASGEFLKAVGSAGTGNGQFERPTDVAIDAKGNLWVTDANNGRIQVFNESGTFVKTVGSPGSGNLQFNGPECIAIDAKGNIWVGDTYNHRLQKLNEKGEFVRTVSSNGSGEGQMVEPTGIAVGPGGNVWVADWGNQRVEVFSETGAFVRQFGSPGAGDSQFQRPDSIEVEANGNVFVGDESDQIRVFNQSGDFLAKFGAPGTGAGQFNLSWPMGIAADGKGTLWISDTGNNRVQKWQQINRFDSQATTVSYDELGRPTSYEDADGNVSKTTYDLEGRPVTTTDDKGSQTVTYDSTSGLPVRLEDSAAGTFTAAYDADGNMIERGLPNGLTAKTTYDETGTSTHLTYTKAANCGESCTWLDFNLEHSINDQILSETGTFTKDSYSYDKAGRLIEARETPQDGQCRTRVYTYDEDSNRKSMTTRAPGIGGVCATSGGTAQSYKYDAADRLEGPTYDAWGRITSLPAEFAGGKVLATSYFGNDMVASQSQGTITNSFQLDASLRQRQRLQGGAGLEGFEVFHYDGSSDSPAWTQRGETWTRNIPGLGGELVAVQESGKEVVLQLTNLHGDIVATAALNPAETQMKATYGFDEFGRPLTGSAGRFGWLGGKQRRTELPSGVIQMGARSYVPAIGRFLSVDPVSGGSANSYDYAEADPVNGYDIAGTCTRKRCQQRQATRANRTYGGGYGGRRPPRTVPLPSPPSGHRFTFKDCVPESATGAKIRTGTAFVSGGESGGCIPKAVVGPINRINFPAMAPIAKAVGFSYCVDVHTFAGSTSLPGLAMTAVSAAAFCSGERAWAYVHVT
jgi:RHS repeat-associated protein